MAQQLAFHLRKLGAKVSMYDPYARIVPGTNPFPAQFHAYGNTLVTDFQGQADDILIVPETMTELLSGREKMRCAIWWMSVDNYFAALRRFTPTTLWWRLKHTLGQILFPSPQPFRFPQGGDRPLFHLYQSEYARNFLCAKGIAVERMFRLGDYINPAFHTFTLPEEPREDRVLYNPQKGFEITQGLMAAAPDLTFEALVGLTRDEMAQKMRSSKLYIDFGTHPGKDRIPREACTLGCCIVTNRKGSAANPVDIPIPERFKLDDSNVDPVKTAALFRAILQDFPAVTQEFTAYRDIIGREEADFVQDIRTIFAL